MKNKIYPFLFIAIILTTILSSCLPGKNSELSSSNIKSTNRKTFSVQYPAGWYIDSLDDDFNPDKLFSINTDSGENYISFYLFDEAISIEDHVNTMVETNKELIMRDGVVTPFSSWGKFKGKGAVMSGSFFSANEGKIKIFAYTTAKKGFLIYQHTYNSDEALYKEGFDLIEKTFELK
jgi:hypothetical protein